MKLVIVESPTKAKTIGRFLGDDYKIVASMGHVMDLPKSKLGVDVEHNFTPQFEMSVDKKKTITELQSLAKKADEIILATDPDREGEAIAANIAEVLNLDKGEEKLGVDFVDIDKKSKISKHAFSRIAFHEITQEAIQDALKSPGKINEDLVAAQIARRVLDRLVGYKLSPLLWQKVRRGLSAGRVQSVALRLIVEREKEIEKFKKEPYYTIAVELKRQKVQQGGPHVAKAPQDDISQSVNFELIEINDNPSTGSGLRKIEISEKLKLYDGEYAFSKTVIDSEQKAKEIEEDLKIKIFTVEDVVKKETKRSPQPPFTTSTLQQQAANRYGYSGKRTMSLAQKLYEEGYITYHRTDSLNMAASAVFAMRKYVEELHGANYIPEKPRFYSSKQKNAQEAHEAIRPTKAVKTPDDVAKDLGRDYAKLYELIWRRALASQMADARIESTSISVLAHKGKSNHTYRLKTNGSILLFDGFLKMNPFGLEDKKVPDFKALEILDLLSVLAESHETMPMPRYNDASLIKSLEEAGIGRPSTYASIIATIEARQYIERDQKKFIPTNVGIAVNDFLVKNFADIDDIPFTAEMEEKLDSVSRGEEKWEPMIADFYKPFEKQLETTKKAARVEIPVEKTGEKCPKDGGDLVIRIGRFGKFISCANFPDCDFKKQYMETVPYTCPKDGGQIVVKKTRKGRPFYGCENYPTCTYAAWKLEDVKKGIIPPEKPKNKHVELQRNPEQESKEKLEDVKKGIIPEKRNFKEKEGAKTTKKTVTKTKKTA